MKECKALLTHLLDVGEHSDRGSGPQEHVETSLQCLIALVEHLLVENARTCQNLVKHCLYSISSHLDTYNYTNVKPLNSDQTLQTILTKLCK